MNRILAELQQQGATSGGSTARDPNGELRRQVLKVLLRVCVCAPVGPSVLPGVVCRSAKRRECVGLPSRCDMEWQAREALAAESGQALARRTQRLLYDTERASLEAELSTIEDKLAAQVFGETCAGVSGGFDLGFDGCYRVFLQP